MSGTSDAPLMLGVSGLRGIVGKSLTPEVAERYAGAFVRWLRRDAGADRLRVVIGRDGRAGGETLHEAAIGAMVGLGCEVIDLGVAMTPTVGVMVDRQRAHGGMIVTASHNPQEWNGLKCLVRAAGAPPVDAAAPPAATAGRIIEEFRSAGGAGVAEGGSVRERGSEGAGAHAGLVFAGQSDLVGGGAGRVNGLKVALDSVNGAGGHLGHAVLAGLGCVVRQIGADGSGIFPHTPEPTRENLTGLCQTVREHGAAVGFAQDPDGDRLAIIDERGEYIGEEYTLVLAAAALLSARDAGSGEGVICVNLSTSRMIDDVAARYGVRVVRTAVGEANVVEAMKREKAAGRDVILGGEGNGGVIWPRVTYVRDSLSAMALVLALMARTGKTVGQLVAEIPAYSIEKRKVDLARKEDATPAVEKLAAAYKGERIDRQDGIRIDFDDRRAWLHVRASNTEPIMRLIAEAPGEEAARAILDEAARVIAG